jgi:hypothetical protein
MKINYNACLRTSAKKMTAKDTKACINHFLFNPSDKQKDNELLTVVLLKEKSHHLDFLRGYTQWNSVGRWQETPDEKNVSIEVQFKDAKNEEVGTRLMKLFNILNKKEIKEDQIYCRTMPIEETTL